MTLFAALRNAAVALLAASLAAGCGSSSTAPAKGKTADERPERYYSGPNACTPGTDVILAEQQGSPPGQVICGNTVPDSTGANQHVFLGIQYAAAPESLHRWTDPRPPQWIDKPATEYGPTCPQGKGKDIAQNDTKEDCLYLNVWTPKLTPGADGDLPVMVFIHGGAFISGSGGSAKGQQAGHLNMYDGTNMVAASRSGGAPVVFVTLNYRLGVLGFLAGDKIGLSGNWGLKDQTAALQWVQRNISRFGGNPAKVTIFGESAGAQSTALHLTMPGDQGLFARAILESNYAINYMTVPEAQQKASAFATVSGCGLLPTEAEKLACLRILPLRDVLDLQTKGAWTVNDLECEGLQAIIPWNPVVDGTVVTQDPILANVTKPFVVGSNYTESYPFIDWMAEGGPLGKHGLATEAEWASAYALLMLGIFGPDDAAKITAEYALYEAAHGAHDTLTTVVTDYMWTCFNRSFAATDPHAGVASWRYLDVHFPSYPIWVDANDAVSGPVDQACATSPAVCHANELPFVFGNPTDMQMVEHAFTPAETTLVGQLQTYWIEFARNGSPSPPPPLLDWPRSSEGSVLQIAAPPTGMTLLPDDTLSQTARCGKLWDGIGYVVKSAASGSPRCQKE